MKYTTFLITFDGGDSMEQIAMTMSEAKILAPAARINKARSYDITSIWAIPEKRP